MAPREYLVLGPRKKKTEKLGKEDKERWSEK